MTHTTRLQRAEKPKPARTAPRYPTLKPDELGRLSQTELRRYNLQHDLQDILDAEPDANLDVRCVGMPSSYRARDGSPSTDEAALNGVEAASQICWPAVDWLAEKSEAIGNLIRAARHARQNWPRPLPAGTTVSQDGHAVKVGAQSVQTSVCAWCDEPAPSGRHPVTGASLVKFGLHSPTCYQAAYRAAAAAGVTIPQVLAERAGYKLHTGQAS